MPVTPLSPSEPGLGLVRDGHTTLLKWHRGKRRITDVPFTAARIEEGLRLGASVEVDLRIHAGGGFAVLHDDTLDRETTGAGPIAAATPETLRALHLRHPDRTPAPDPVLVLEDLFAALDGLSLPETALLQLDLKETLPALDRFHAAAFGHAAAPLARHLIVSGGDAAAVARLAAACPGIQVGFDPCYSHTYAELERTGTFERFITDALAVMPQATMIYLDWHIVRLAASRGFDLIAPCHAAGKTVDAWTLNVTEPDVAAMLRLLLDLKVDQVTTDDPVEMQAVGLGL
jgi:glycerophosphoryl diester phosphodiesterase